MCVDCEALGPSGCLCDRGYYRSNDGERCVACPPGTYKDAVGGVTNLTSCRSCPLGFTTLPPATSAASCLECRANTYAANTSLGGITCMPCPQGSESPPRSVGVEACQAHTEPKQVYGVKLDFVSERTIKEDHKHKKHKTQLSKAPPVGMLCSKLRINTESLGC